VTSGTLHTSWFSSAHQRDLTPGPEHSDARDKGVPASVGQGLPRRTTQDAPTSPFNEVHQLHIKHIRRRV
jgi:hypothetical protein